MGQRMEYAMDSRRAWLYRLLSLYIRAKVGLRALGPYGLSTSMVLSGLL